MEIGRTAAAAAADGGWSGGEKTEMVARGRSDVKPVLGIGIALFFAGIVVSQLRPRSRPPPPPPPSRQTSSAESKTGGSDSIDRLEELRIPKGEEALSKSNNVTSTTAVKLSSTSSTSGNEQGVVLPESNDTLIKESEVTSKDMKTAPETAMGQEIASLRELVSSLRERKRNLELQLLAYRGANEKEAAAKELENRLKISTVEAKLYALRIQSLQDDKRRLESQLADHSRTRNELEASRAKIKVLKQKLKADREQAKEMMASLHQRISSLQCREQKDEVNDAELEKKLKGLEDETVELRMVNSRLAEENSGLVMTLASTQMTAAASQVLQGAEVEASQEADRSREANRELMEEIEQLRTDRYADAEELVYLRWVNACLRYELRNYQPPPGRTVARDLSKGLSPKSEAKAKQLILEYANSGAPEKSSNLAEIYSEFFSSSSSQASSEEPEDTAINASSSTKAKFLSKLKKLVLGKGKQNTGTWSEIPENGASFSTCSADDVIRRRSYDSSTDQLAGMEAQTTGRQHDKDVSSRIYSRLSSDIQMLLRPDAEEAREEKGIPHRNDPVDQEHTYIKKLADALMDSRQAVKRNGRPASFSS
ncbi:hypothetical protein C4D60_Mb10t03300 [Musa balbisiana]|uniref:Protein CHUP1, chloroplastic n=1 Tax=Musa balbisiana TaxID=52838 RepID=A0A4S8IUF5_MUSBA|nr:hypothetical protein C4D60_Mb10t03300 [Musa balbisiana]